MLTPRALRWLHRVGYITTLIVLVEATVIGYVGLNSWQRSRALIERSRGHEGPIEAQPKGFVRDAAVLLLRRLPSLQELPSNSVRFVAMPSFGRDWFAISLKPEADKALGILVIARMKADPVDGVATWDQPRQFQMPYPAYQAMVGKLDDLANEWAGEDAAWTDGTAFGFERKNDDKINSGLGNSPRHYDKIAALVRDSLAPYVPDVAHVDAAWMARDEQNVR